MHLILLTLWGDQVIETVLAFWCIYFDVVGSADEGSLGVCEFEMKRKVGRKRRKQLCLKGFWKVFERIRMIEKGEQKIGLDSFSHFELRNFISFTIE